MLEKFSKMLTDLFGDAGKWVLVAILAVLIILCIVLTVFVAIHIKWVLLGGSATAVLVIAGLIIHKKLKDNQ